MNMKINKTKILIYTEEKGLLEFPGADYSINMVSGDHLTIVGTFECDGEALKAKSVHGLSGFQVLKLLASRTNVIDFLNGNITKRKLRKLEKQLGVLNDNVSKT